MLLQYEKIGRKQIRIMPKQDPRANLKANLFVKDIDKEVTPKDLHNHFNTIGRVVTAQIATDASGKSLGYGYVQFESTEDAKRALEQLQNSKLKEKEISVQEFVQRRKDNIPALTPIFSFKICLRIEIKKRLKQFSK